jgi:hypothetical protein
VGGGTNIMPPKKEKPPSRQNDKLSDWFDNNPALALLVISVLAVLAILFLNLLTGCPQTSYRGSYLKITSYRLDDVKWKRTPKGIRVHGDSKDTYAEIDRLTDELEACFRARGLAKSVQRDWFAVFVPPDWYTSQCGTKEQLVPSRVDYRLCEQKKDPEGNPIKIPVVCRNVERPTKECPCPCNIRAGIQNSRARPVIVTAPNLKLYKAELTRIVLWPRANNPWADKEVVPCLK